MHKVFYVNHFVINPDNWIVNLLVTFAGVGLALLLQELVNYHHRKQNTSRFARSFIGEIDYNLLIAQSIIESCDGVLQRMNNPQNRFGFSAVFTVSGIALIFRKDAYEAAKQSEQYLNFPPEISFKISKAYSRLNDINLFVSTMVKTWEASVEEAEREDVETETVNDQRKEQTRVIITGVRAIAVEAQTNLRELLAELKVS